MIDPKNHGASPPPPVDEAEPAAGSPAPEGASRGDPVRPAAPSATPSQGDATDRRGALRTLVLVGSAAYTGALVVPAARFLAGTAAGGGAAGGRWVRVARLADLAPGTPRRLAVIGDRRDAFTVSKREVLGSVWLVREGEDVRALSATCPHLGCSIDLGGDGKSFACPCHTSRFALSGAVESGPSPRGMDALAARVVDGFVEVDFRRYREGVPDRQEVGG